MKRTAPPFPWLALALLVLSLGAFWGVPRLLPEGGVGVVFEEQAK